MDRWRDFDFASGEPVSPPPGPPTPDEGMLTGYRPHTGADRVHDQAAYGSARLVFRLPRRKTTVSPGYNVHEGEGKQATHYLVADNRFLAGLRQFFFAGKAPVSSGDFGSSAPTNAVAARPGWSSLPPVQGYGRRIPPTRRATATYPTFGGGAENG